MAETTYTEMAELLGRQKDAVQNACNRYASRAPKVIRKEGQVKIFDQDEMIKFFVWYDNETQDAAAQGSKRAPRTALEIEESNLIRHTNRRDKALASVARVKERLERAEAEVMAADDLIASTKKKITFHRKQQNANR